jgi:hypothetical protein
MLAGPFSDVGFARDLAAPMRWVTPQDQPDVRFGGAAVNKYPKAWPADGGDAACVAVSC